MADMKEELRFAQEQSRKTAEEYPEFMKGFSAFGKAVMSPGVLSVKTKELIAVSLAVIKQCSYCIAWHVQAARKEGATDAEIMEAAFVACLFGGGPAWMYSNLVKKALEDLPKAP